MREKKVERKKVEKTKAEDKRKGGETKVFGPC